MLEAFSHMLWPLLACFVLVGIHAYLGIHVIARKVIFVDLALAQLAALGAVYGVFIGISIEVSPWLLKAVSVVFTLFGALLFSFTRSTDDRVPHEAIIGIIYAAALSMTLLLTANLPHGADEVSQMLAGNILWVTPREVIYTAILYAIVGFFFLLFQKAFFLLSQDIALKGPKTLNIKWWDFLFYSLFGLVVTSSVSIGGVLLVFGYLVIPSTIGIKLASSTKRRLLIGLAFGLITSLVGVIASYYLELPSGPTIVVLLALTMLVVNLILEIRKRESRRAGFYHACSVLAILILLMLIMKVGRWCSPHMTSHEHGGHQELTVLLKGEDDVKVIGALEDIQRYWLISMFDDVASLLSTGSDKVRSFAILVLIGLDEDRARDVIKSRLGDEKDIFIRLEMACSLAKLGYTAGLLALVDMAQNSEGTLAKDDALACLQDLVPDHPPDAAAITAWLKQNLAQLTFDPKSKKYHIKHSF